ncbi:MAG: response regulator [Opitutae bacterium]|nr:response regulator [Opitutae bacterium]
MPRPSVLYVEDEPDDVLFMHVAFRRAGVTAPLHCVSDGQQAVNYLRGAPPYDDRVRHPLPSVVLLDLNLPLLSGFDVLHWIRHQSPCRDIPVVVFSSSGRAEDRRRAEDLRASDYWLKPSSGTEFEATARELHERWLKSGA